MNPPHELQRPMFGAVVPLAPTRREYAAAKRALDIIASSAGLIVSTPLMLGIAIAVKLDSPGPVFFRQQRIGRGGHPFGCLKFRSMHVAADEAAHRRHISGLMRRDAPAEGAWLPIERDERVTRVGGMLRRTHLDELPQLVNIIRGEMSLVGPRPPIPYEVELYEPWHLGRLAVTPGLTGLWQVTGWGRLSFDEGVKLDLEYVRCRSLWLDLSIIVRTVWQILIRRQF